VVADDERETATNLAAAPPEPPVAPRRSKLPHLVATVAILAIAAGAAWSIVRRLESGYRYREEVTAVLRELASGDPAKVEALYRDAAPRFKQSTIVDGFLELGDRVEQTLGGFREVVDITEVERASTVAGATTRVRVEAAFAKARVDAEVSFLADAVAAGGTPRQRLLGVTIAIPEANQELARLVERSPLGPAPADAVAVVRAVAELLREGRVGAEAPAAGAPAIEPAVVAELRAAHPELGGFVGLVEIIASAQGAAKDRARVQALLAYQRQRTTATFTLARRDARWALVDVALDVPAPVATRSGPPPAPDPRGDDAPDPPLSRDSVLEAPRRRP
jgi:hypothetical protein